MALSVASPTWLPSGSRATWLRAAWHYVPIAIFVVVWQLVVDLGLVDRAFLPSFTATVAALWEMTRNGEIAVNLARLTLVFAAYRALRGHRPVPAPQPTAAQQLERIQ